MRGGEPGEGDVVEGGMVGVSVGMDEDVNRA